jgi:hypothetical protein
MEEERKSERERSAGKVGTRTTGQSHRGLSSQATNPPVTALDSRKVAPGAH